MTLEGPSSVRILETATFAAVVTGVSNAQVVWSVDGFPGGTPDVGTITTTGRYSPPSTVSSHTISAESVAVPGLIKSVQLDVLNAVPRIDYGVVTSIDGSNYLATISGTGFLPNSSLSLGTVINSYQYISSTEATVSFALASSPRSTLPVVITNPSPDSAASNQYELALPPAYQALTTCTNPNTRTPWGAWGSGPMLYEELTNTTRLMVVAPRAENSVYWTSQENMPGRSILLQGAFTATPKTARVALIPPGTDDWQSVISTNSRTASVTQITSASIALSVPADMEAGVYGYQLEDSGAQPISGLVNVPAIDWMIGTPASPTAATALQGHVLDCAATAGGELRVFGRNFKSDSQLVIESGAGVVYPLEPVRSDSTSMVAKVPLSVPPGTYYAWIGNSPWDATSSTSSIIHIAAPKAVVVDTFECRGLVADGVTDNAPSLQSCFDANAPPADGSRIASIRIAGGTYTINNAVVMHPFEVLKGEASGETMILAENQDPSSPPVGGAWLTIPAHAAVVDISITAPDNRTIITSLDCTGNPDTSGDIFLYGSKLRSTISGATTITNNVVLCGPDIQVYNSFFQGIGPNSASVLGIAYADGAIVANNTFDVGHGSTEYAGPQNLDIEYNDYSYIAPLNGAYGNTAIDVGRPFDKWGPSKMVANIYIGYNDMHDMGSTSNCTVITGDGGGGAYYGPIESGTADTITLAEEPFWGWTGITNPSTIDAVIVSGTGAGQYAPLKSVSGRVITLAKPWIVQPDSTSIVDILVNLRNVTVAHNVFKNNINIQMEAGNSLNGQIEDNLLENAGRGILLRAYGPYGGPSAFGPVLNATVVRNQLTVGRGDLIVPSQKTNVGGIGVFNGYGTVVVGSIIRDNTVPSIETVYNTNGNNGIDGVIVENNSALWFNNATPQGYLIQGNSITP